MYQTILSEIRNSVEPSIMLGNDVWKIIYSFIYNKHPCSIMIKGFFENVDKIYHDNISDIYDEIKNGNMLYLSHIVDISDMDNSKVINMMIEIIYFDMHRLSNNYIENKEEQEQFIFSHEHDGSRYRHDMNNYTSKLSELYRQMKTEDRKLSATNYNGFVRTKWEYTFENKREYHNYLESIRQEIRNYGFNSTGMINITLKAPWKNRFQDGIPPPWLSLEKDKEEYVKSKNYKYEDWIKEQENMEQFLKMNSDYEVFVSRYKNIGKIYCQCPFKNKDDIKKLGFKWDADKKKWYITKSDLTGEVLHEASKFVKFL